jgi:hypothetical protein
VVVVVVVVMMVCVQHWQNDDQWGKAIALMEESAPVPLSQQKYNLVCPGIKQ